MQHTAHLNLGTPFPQLILSMVTLPAKCWLMANMFLSELLEIRFVKTSRPVFANPCQASSGSQHCLHEKIFHWAVAIMASRILEDDISNGTTFTAALASFLQNSTLERKDHQESRDPKVSWRTWLVLKNPIIRNLTSPASHPVLLWGQTCKSVDYCFSVRM